MRNLLLWIIVGLFIISIWLIIYKNIKNNKNYIDTKVDNSRQIESTTIKTNKQTWEIIKYKVDTHRQIEKKELKTINTNNNKFWSWINLKKTDTQIDNIDTKVDNVDTYYINSENDLKEMLKNTIKIKN